MQAGWSKHLIDIPARGLAMHGFGQSQHRAQSVRTPLYARAVVMGDTTAHAAIICCLDLGYVTYAMRAGVVARLQAELGAGFDEEALLLTCTHTHSGPGGCAHEALYNLVTPGFVAEHVDAIVAACSTAIVQAWQSAASTQIEYAEGRFDAAVEVAWNRSLSAYNRNPEVEARAPTQSHLAIERAMQVISLRRNGQLEALISLFGVHATCLGNDLRAHDGDNKGYAAAQAEAALQRAGAAAPVAIFAQATAGDVSPHYHGPGQGARRRRLKAEADQVAYAQHNARLQSEHALALARAPAPMAVEGDIDAALTYVDFTQLRADPVFADGIADACTSEPCHGVAFFVGTPVDGLGMPKALGVGARLIARALKARRLKSDHPQHAHYRALYAAQGNKDVLMEAGSQRVLGQPLATLKLPGWVDPVVAEMKRQARAGALTHSALVPTVLPLQILIIGSLALIAAPGEFTTVAGARLRQSVDACLRARGITRTLICTYCNEYMGYVTTQPEYQQQNYEGGHTIFGQWTLAAFQTRFTQLAATLCQPPGARSHDRTTRPAPPPAQELAQRTARL
ncbi:neutral/alkaline non-lysosomal ceramidase N-terminal domain-containing protein [Sinimarinibacterium sp. NLF-5-8]|uniref:neutral/alkaline non-lysosomal ceramidase N-terminal domain-containing protein n=1 Tax=Sinimarinibacterium sp. NLF-5-8 TaxID=2698684 RepID=UPI00192EA5C5|nr:neutral/alkaline non-lysosomal ceramidase N-terminal domain-containing protein [Sinimarinibacterium sp. NLF-5-8]